MPPHYGPLSAMFVLCLAVIFGFIATTLMLVAVTTDYWEHIAWDSARLRNLSQLWLNESFFSDADHFYKVVLVDAASENHTRYEYFLRSSYGGIWKICDYISAETKERAEYREGLDKTTFLKYDCFHYIQQYGERRKDIDQIIGVWLVRMQNSAASCMIVALLCLLTAAITGTFGICTKQVSSCMVTGVMYIVGGVFVCFGLVIMHTKVDFSDKNCSTLDLMADSLPSSMCKAKTVFLGWSASVGWVAFGFLLLAHAFWLLLARYMRLEKAKSML